MSDLKKTIEEEYLINDVLKLILEAQRLDEFKKGEAEEFYNAAIDAFARPPDKSDLSPEKLKSYAAKYANVFGFSETDRIEQRISRINDTYSVAARKEYTAGVPSVSDVLSELDLLTLFYKVVNNYEATTAGFLMESLLVTVLTGQEYTAELPEGNPVEDIVIKREGEITKAYSLKTYRQNFSEFGNNFLNFIRLFALTPDLDYLSYIIFEKIESDGQVSQLKVGEILLSPTGETGIPILDAFNVNFLSSLTTKEQRIKYILDKLPEDRKKKFIDDLIQGNLATREEVSNSSRDIEANEAYHKQQLKDYIDKQEYTKILDHFAIFTKEDYSKIDQKYGSELSKIFKSYGQIRDFLGEAPEPHTIEDFTPVNLVKVKNFRMAGEYSKFITPQVNVRKYTSFKVKLKVYREKSNELGVLSISKKDFINLIQENESTLKGVVQDAFLKLNYINDRMDKIFKQGQTNFIGATVKKCGEFYETSKKFKKIKYTIKE